MTDDWQARARADLLRLRDRRAWGDRLGGEPRVEPTALAGLALLANGDDPAGAEAARGAAGWLAGVQQPDGALGVSARLPAPHWATSHALLLWANLGGPDAAADRASGWLLRQCGLTDDDPGGAVGHDARIVGWPWVESTHSWLEPTAMAVLALKRRGLGDHPRVREGLRLIRDRAIVTGGWNYGNNVVFRRTLRPQPAPTGLALLALAGDGPASRDVERGLSYLLGALPTIRSAASLAWGLLALRAWSRTPPGSDRWPAEAHALLGDRPDAAPRLAALLLAAGERSLDLLGMAGDGAGEPGGQGPGPRDWKSSISNLKFQISDSQ